MANPLGFEDNLDPAQVTQYDGEDPSKSTGKYIKIEVPDFMNTGNAMGLGSYLRLGAIEDKDRAGKAPPKLTNASPSGTPWDGVAKKADGTPDAPAQEGPQEVVGLVTDAAGNLLQPDPDIDPPLAVKAFLSADPSGEDLASLVQGFADDSRNRGIPDPTAGGQPWSTGTTAVGREVNYGDAIVYPQGTTSHPDVSAPTATPTADGGSGLKKPKYPTDDYRVLESSQLHTKGGWRDHSDGNRITTTRGDKVEVIRGNYKLLVLGRQDQTKAKLAGMDISGGQSDTGGSDLTADASTDQSPFTTSFSNVFEWKKVEGDDQFRSYSTAKKGSGPKVATKPQKATADVPAVTPDGRTFALPITGSVAINETWSYITYNYTGLGYARALTPPVGSTTAPKAPDYTKGGDQPDPAKALSGSDSAGTPYSPMPDYQMYPVALTVNKSYVWDQTSETYANSTWTITAGPRTTKDAASGLYNFPTTTTAAGAPYDPLVPVPIIGSGSAPMAGGPGPDTGLPQVFKPGTNVGEGPGDYNKVQSITAETHVEKQFTYTVAGTTFTQTGTSDEPVKSQTTKNYVHSTSTENHYTSQHTSTVAATSETENTIGAQNTFNTVGAQNTFNTYGAQSTILTAGVTSSIGATGTAFTMSASLMTAAIKATILELSLSVAQFHFDITTVMKTNIHNGVDLTVHAAPKVDIAALRTALEGTTLEVNGPSGHMRLSSLHLVG